MGSAGQRGGRAKEWVGLRRLGPIGEEPPLSGGMCARSRPARPHTRVLVSQGEGAWAVCPDCRWARARG